MAVLPLKDVVKQDLARAAHASTGAREVSLPTLLAWRRGAASMEITDTSGKPILHVNANAVLATLLHKDTWETIERACKDQFVFLGDDTWAIAAGVSNSSLAERFLKKALAFTSVSDLDPAGPLMGTMQDITTILTFPVVKTIIIDAVRRQPDVVERVRRWLALLGAVAVHEEARLALAISDIATVLETCTTAIQRKGYTEFIAQHPSSKPLIGALLRSGSNSDDLGVDVLGLLDTMDPAGVNLFLATDARVVHRNYLFRLVCVRSNQVTTEVMVAALRRLLASNPWALERQFASWKRRISAGILDARRVEAVTSEVAQLVDRARRAMIFSPELAPAALHTWQDEEMLQQNGYTITRVSPGGDNGPGHDEIPGPVASFFQQQLAGQEQALVVMRGPRASGIKAVLPRGAKNEPWICIEDGTVTGLGLSGLRLRRWPAMLDAVPGLQVLDASNNSLDETGPLAGFPALRYVDLSRNNLNEFACGGPLNELSVLDLHGNVLKRVDVTVASKRLRVLDVSRNDIEKVAALQGLAGCGRLDACNLAWNRLGSMARFPALDRLARLYAGGNGMVRLDVEGTCKGLRHADLSDNNLGALKGIGAFPNLVHLDVSRNYLKHVKDVVALQDLQVFLAADNQVTTNEPLKALPALATLDLRGNPLDEIPQETRARLLLGPR